VNIKDVKPSEWIETRAQELFRLRIEAEAKALGATLGSFHCAANREKCPDIWEYYRALVEHLDAQHAETKP
jgi:hypothetical protein